MFCYFFLQHSQFLIRLVPLVLHFFRYREKAARNAGIRYLIFNCTLTCIRDQIVVLKLIVNNHSTIFPILVNLLAVNLHFIRAFITWRIFNKVFVLPCLIFLYSNLLDSLINIGTEFYI